MCVFVGAIIEQAQPAGTGRSTVNESNFGGGDGHPTRQKNAINPLGGSTAKKTVLTNAPCPIIFGGACGLALRVTMRCVMCNSHGIRTIARITMWVVFGPAKAATATPVEESSSTVCSDHALYIFMLASDDALGGSVSVVGYVSGRVIHLKRLVNRH